MEPTFSKALEDDFNDFEADYSIRQAEHATSSDSEEEEMLESLECEYQPTDTVNVSLQVEDNEETKRNVP